MSDPLLRLVVVLGVTVLVGVIAGWQRWVTPARGRSVASTGLAPGDYLLTSDSCLDCATAWERAIRAVGSDRLSRVRWEDRPSVFEALGVVEVPALVRVAADGSGRVYRGVPPRVLSKFNP